MIRYSPLAAEFIRKEKRYLNAHSRNAARQFVRDVADVTLLLKQYPMIGGDLGLLRGTPLEGIRRWVKGNYIFDYRITPNGDILVLLVRHHAQDDPYLEHDSDDDFDD
ncbi:type II toxin-antitoxin system RelE/ParE family toxin [Mesorhizobium sp. ASY16-5R]|uniref:type II toxin-antitoxin system RelE/ParE family toxin n=1 Tax=Mesorhizobium sp. ASY16-5R TaxID=3445772 RepID=UPI003FA1038E